MKRVDDKRSGPDISRADALSFRPVINDQVREEVLDSGEVLLSYPVVLRPWFARLVRRLGGAEEPVRFRKLQLDELGSAVWRLLDGRRTVRQVVDAFADAYRLHRREAEVSVTEFLRMLGKRGIVGMR